MVEKRKGMCVWAALGTGGTGRSVPWIRGVYLFLEKGFAMIKSLNGLEEMVQLWRLGYAPRPSKRNLIDPTPEAKRQEGHQYGEVKRSGKRGTSRGGSTPPPPRRPARHRQNLRDVTHSAQRQTDHDGLHGPSPILLRQARIPVEDKCCLAGLRPRRVLKLGNYVVAPINPICRRNPSIPGLCRIASPTCARPFELSLPWSVRLSSAARRCILRTLPCDSSLPP